MTSDQKIDFILNDVREIRKDNENFKLLFKDIFARLDFLERKNQAQDNEIGLLKEQNDRLSAELKALKIKVTDASNRQRRRNIKIKYLPEIPETQDLAQFLTSWWSSLGYKISRLDLERAHRGAPKPTAKIKTRDVIVAFARESKRDEFLRFFKSLGAVFFKNTRILIFADIEPETLAQRQSLSSITSAIRNKGFKFSWGFPALIIVYHQGRRLTASNLSEGKALLNALGIQQSPSTVVNPPPDHSLASDSSDSESGESSSLHDNSLSADQLHNSESAPSIMECNSAQSDNDKKRKGPCLSSPESKTKKKKKPKKSSNSQKKS